MLRSQHVRRAKSGRESRGRLRLLVLVCGVALLCALLLAPVGAVGKKKKMGKWWGTFVATDSAVEQARPGARWEYTLRVNKSDRTYTLDGGTARLPCFEVDDANPNTPMDITEWYEFEIPDWSGKIKVIKRFREALVVNPPLDYEHLEGQAPSGRPWGVEVRPQEIFYNVLFKRNWGITFVAGFDNCEGALPSRFGSRGFQTVTKRVG